MLRWKLLFCRHSFRPLRFVHFALINQSFLLCGTNKIFCFRCSQILMHTRTWILAFFQSSFVETLQFVLLFLRVFSHHSHLLIGQRCRHRFICPFKSASRSDGNPAKSPKLQLPLILFSFLDLIYVDARVDNTHANSLNSIQSIQLRFLFVDLANFLDWLVYKTNTWLSDAGNQIFWGSIAYVEIFWISNWYDCMFWLHTKCQRFFTFRVYYQIILLLFLALNFVTFWRLRIWKTFWIQKG